ncbi:hypothetical protein DAMA08_037090 [Martiniozyma asiatica (nom. inval.)]|nr:hypothetical protein DAMA08_037090 [Martiniozyma asiatica]
MEVVEIVSEEDDCEFTSRHDKTEIRLHKMRSSNSPDNVVLLSDLENEIPSNNLLKDAQVISFETTKNNRENNADRNPSNDSGHRKSNDILNFNKIKKQPGVWGTSMSIGNQPKEDLSLISEGSSDVFGTMPHTGINSSSKLIPKLTKSCSKDLQVKRPSFKNEIINLDSDENIKSSFIAESLIHSIQSNDPPIIANTIKAKQIFEENFKESTPLKAGVSNHCIELLLSSPDPSLALREEDGINPFIETEHSQKGTNTLDVNQKFKNQSSLKTPACDNYEALSILQNPYIANASINRKQSKKNSPFESLLTDKPFKLSHNDAFLSTTTIRKHNTEPSIADQRRMDFLHTQRPRSSSDILENSSLVLNNNSHVQELKQSIARRKQKAEEDNLNFPSSPIAVNNVENLTAESSILLNGARITQKDIIHNQVGITDEKFDNDYLEKLFEKARKIDKKSLADVNKVKKDRENDMPKEIKICISTKLYEFLLTLNPNFVEEFKPLAVESFESEIPFIKFKRFEKSAYYSKKLCFVPIPPRWIEEEFCILVYDGPKFLEMTLDKTIKRHHMKLLEERNDRKLIMFINHYDQVIKGLTNKQNRKYEEKMSQMLQRQAHEAEELDDVSLPPAKKKRLN